MACYSSDLLVAFSAASKMVSGVIGLLPKSFALDVLNFGSQISTHTVHDNLIYVYLQFADGHSGSALMRVIS